MDYEAAKFWFDILQTIVMGAISIWVYVANRRAAHKTEVNERLQEIGDRMTVAEQKIVHAPDDTDLERIYDRMNQVSGEVKGLVGEFQAVRRTLELMHQHMLSRQQ